MKPDWTGAPDWAQWLSTDYLGASFFEHEPQFHRVEGMWFEGVFYSLTGREQTASIGRFEKSLERRP